MPAIRDATFMQVSALVDLSAVIMRAEMQAEGLGALEHAAGPNCRSWHSRRLARDPIGEHRKDAARSPRLDPIHIS